MMQGEINVSEFMDRLERLNEWSNRHARDAEWTALKQWWSAQRKLRAAYGNEAKTRAWAEPAQLERRYHAELMRVWPKWHRAQEELAARRKNPCL